MKLSSILQHSPTLVQVHVAGNSFEDLTERDVKSIIVWEDGHLVCPFENEPTVILR